MQIINCKNGDDCHPIYQFLKKDTNLYDEKKKAKVSDVPWNFAKFLVDKDGQVVKFYAPGIPPFDIKDDIVKLL